MGISRWLDRPSAHLPAEASQASQLIIDDADDTFTVLFVGWFVCFGDVWFEGPNGYQL